jgi:membrane-associated phospholipid phosphatase
MTQTKQRFIALAPLVLAASSLSTPAQAGPKDWGTVSDVGVYTLIAASVAVPVAKHDKQGAFQAVGSFAATSLVTEGLKQAFPKTRPDGSDRKSFPSGHTSRAFSSAATLYNRQGPAIGVPAFIVASLVGVARVKADKHFWSDVAVGAAIGTASGFLITRNRPSEAQATLMPWGDTKGGGLAFAMRF